MAENLTDVDTFPATIQMPENGEANSASELRDMAIQRLANRTRYLYNQGLLVFPATTFQASLTGSAIPSGQQIVISSGVSYGPGPNYSVSSDAITVPAVGQYTVTVTGRVTSTSTTDGMNFGFRVLVAGSSVARIDGTRFSAVAGDAILVSGTVLVDIADTDTDTITIEAYEGTPAGVTPSNARVTIVRVG